MKRKIILFASLMLMAACVFALCANAQAICAEGEHTGEWQIDFDQSKVLTKVHSTEICTKCNLVLKDESLAPLIEDKGFSYYNGSMVQGYYIDADALEAYEARTGKSIGYGVVAAVENQAPLGENAVPTGDNVISVNLKDIGSEHFEIKITEIPSEKSDVKIVLCAYLNIDGQVVYVDNGYADNNVAGVTYNEVVNLLENGVQPTGLYEYRELTLDELDLLCQSYYNSTQYAGIRKTGNSTAYDYFATKLFTRSELPSGSYVEVGQGWTIRPELFKASLGKNSSRPSTQSASGGVLTLSIDDFWALNSEFEYLGFNISDTKGYGGVSGYTDESIAEIFKIYVPVNTTVSKVENEVDTSDSISVAGKKLLNDEEMGLTANKYWNSTTGTNASSGGDKVYYYITKQFTKEELPVGTVIEIDLGWQYRPEYWVGSSTNSTRPANETTFRVEITEDFWDTETTRAFNISKLVKVAIGADDWDDVLGAFKIYVPSTSTLY